MICGRQKFDIENHEGLQFQFNVTSHFLACVIGVFYRVTYYIDSATANFYSDRSHYTSIIWVIAKLEKSNYILWIDCHSFMRNTTTLVKIYI